MPSPHLGKPTESILQVSLQNVTLNTSDKKPHKTLDVEPSPQPDSNEKLRTSSQKAKPICMSHFHSRHAFQQQLIEKQKKKLQEQHKTILELKESQRLAKAWWAAEREAAVMDAQSHLLSNPKEEPKRTRKALSKYVHCIRTLPGLIIWSLSLCGGWASKLCLASSLLGLSFHCALSGQRNPCTVTDP